MLLKKEYSFAATAMLPLVLGLAHLQMARAVCSITLGQGQENGIDLSGYDSEGETFLGNTCQVWEKTVKSFWRYTPKDSSGGDSDFPYAILVEGKETKDYDGNYFRGKNERSVSIGGGGAPQIGIRCHAGVNYCRGTLYVVHVECGGNTVLDNNKFCIDSDKFFSKECNAKDGYDVACEWCPAGQEAPSVPSDYTKSQCLRCAPGFYRPYGGEYGSGMCSSCSSGSVSDYERTGCENCQPGEYAFHDVVSSSCKSCLAGTYSSAPSNGQNTCVSCLAGTWSSEGAARCEECPAGTFSNVHGGTSEGVCEMCPIGYYGSREGSTTVSDCLPCDVFSFQDSPGLSSCRSCIAENTLPGADGDPQVQCNCVCTNNGGVDCANCMNTNSPTMRPSPKAAPLSSSIPTVAPAADPKIAPTPDTTTAPTAVPTTAPSVGLTTTSPADPTTSAAPITQSRTFLLMMIAVTVFF
mmetsp:Transcript_11428/g.21122  ORF Transcript_11428/g.21122 Transcript_11428/m.21122 type:complete len:466 (-) Transcript_11428:141-1538(-)